MESTTPMMEKAMDINLVEVDEKADKRNESAAEIAKTTETEMAAEKPSGDKDSAEANESKKTDEEPVEVENPSSN
ncbi:unnamed protein product [Caenorhabditis bovis]|uniref:Uncharacterized protein n=1 Tax=Caenorhabditis bovis TaxID=2654633 RepID=A0A8S1FFC7_9PELO|nr:unnamed protein product [Caenorhabditis bovis]